jgi:hypothetical protein
LQRLFSVLSKTITIYNKPAQFLTIFGIGDILLKDLEKDFYSCADNDSSLDEKK